MKNAAFSLIDQVKNSKSWDELPPLIEKLVNLGEPALNALLEQNPMVVTSRLHFVCAHVFARVGYPANKSALEFMVSDVSNTNSITWDISREAVLTIGTPVLPVIADVLNFYRLHEMENKSEIDALEEIAFLIRD
jgi:hypothetical protein